MPTTSHKSQVSLPLGRKVPRGKLRWYFVACMEGEEVRTCRKVRRLIGGDLLQDAFAPLAERAIKRQGTWSTYLRCIFDGYFVVATTDAPALAKELARLTFPAHMAGVVGAGFAPMDEDAEQLLAACMDGMHVVRMSVGEIVAKRLRVLEGPLMGREARIRHVDRHKKLAKVRVGSSASGEGFVLALPLDVPAKREGAPEANAYTADCDADNSAGIPLDPRDTSRRPRWYLATCAEGFEDAACADLRARVSAPLITDAFVPHMEQQRKVHGEWKTEDLVLLGGTFIVVTKEIRRLSSRLADVPSGVGLVRGPDGWPAPVAAEAQELLGRVMDDGHVVRLSWSEIVGDELRVQRGPLKGLESRVASHHRRKSVAMVRVREGDDEHLLCLPLAITARRSSGGNSSTA